MRLREAPEEAARCPDLRRSHREGVVEPRGGRPGPRRGVARRGHRRRVPQAEDGRHGGTVVVVRQRSGQVDPGENAL